MKIRCPVLGALASVLTAAPLSAAPRPSYDPPLPHILRLEYLRTEPSAKGCPDAAYFRGVMEGHLHYDPFDPSATPRLRIELAQHGATYHGSLEVRDSEGIVVFSRNAPPDALCTAVLDYLAFALQIRFHQLPEVEPPIRKAEPAGVEPAAPPAAPVRIQPAPPPPAPVKGELPPAPRRERPRGIFGMVGALAVRTAPPMFAPNFRADAGIRWRVFSVEGELGFIPPQELYASGDTRLTASEITGGIAPCGHLEAFFYCGVGQVIAVVLGGSKDLMVPVSTGLTASTGPRLGVDVPLWQGRFAVRLSVDALVTLRPVAIHFEPEPGVWSMPGFTLAIGAGFLMDLGARAEGK